MSTIAETIRPRSLASIGSDFPFATPQLGTASLFIPSPEANLLLGFTIKNKSYLSVTLNSIRPGQTNVTIQEIFERLPSEWQHSPEHYSCWFPSQTTPHNEVVLPIFVLSQLSTSADIGRHEVSTLANLTLAPNRNFAWIAVDFEGVASVDNENNEEDGVVGPKCEVLQIDGNGHSLPPIQPYRPPPALNRPPH